jgi:Mrp family chromosome partitioning ATPase
MLVAIVKYNAGNIYSVDYGLKRLGIEPVITADKEILRKADKIIFPGQGEAGTTMRYLKENRLDELIKELKTKFDYIIIDSAPLGVVADTYQINRVADSVLFVVRQDYTPKEWMAFINDIYYDEGKLNNMSVVLNGTEDVETYKKYNHHKYF